MQPRQVERSAVAGIHHVEQDLKERIPARVPLGLQFRHQLLERQVLVDVGPQATLTDRASNSRKVSPPKPR